MREDEFPRRGEYGPTTGNCEWCGKADRSHWGLYCSRRCSAAGSFTSYIFMTLIMLAFSVGSIFFGDFLAAGFFVFLGLIPAYYVYIGYKMRHQLVV